MRTWAFTFIILVGAALSVGLRAETGAHSFGGRSDQAQRTRAAASPSPAAPSSVPATFRISEYAPPPPNQLGTGRCLYFASTGIAEWLYGRSKCKRGQVGGAGDFSEKAFYEGAHYTSKPFTDTALDFAKTGYVPDSEYQRMRRRRAEARPTASASIGTGNF